MGVVSRIAQNDQGDGFFRPWKLDQEGEKSDQETGISGSLPSFDDPNKWSNFERRCYYSAESDVSFWEVMIIEGGDLLGQEAKKLKVNPESRKLYVRSLWYRKLEKGEAPDPEKELRQLWLSTFGPPIFKILKLYLPVERLQKALGVRIEEDEKKGKEKEKANARPYMEVEREETEKVEKPEQEEGERDEKGRFRPKKKNGNGSS
jgi:hypothetical protein